MCRVPLLAEELPEYNIKTIAASLRCQRLRTKATRKFSPISYREHGLPVSENLWKQDFLRQWPSRWQHVSSITTQKDVVKQLWRLSTKNSYESEALKQAIEIMAKNAGLIGPGSDWIGNG